MHIIRGPLFFVPRYYWRTILLASSVGLAVAAVFNDALAFILCTLACAFVFMDYERRQWLSVSFHYVIGDVLFRCCLVLVLAYRFV